MTEIPPLVIMGDAHLMQAQRAVPPDELASPRFQDRLQVLRAAMGHYQGIGIAAPQIGWGVRVFCMGIEHCSDRYADAPQIEFQFWINPCVKSTGSETAWAWEGCLSVPGMRGWVERPEAIVVSGLDESGQSVDTSLDGFAARVWQHEFDHLDGVLYPSRVVHPRWLVPESSLRHQPAWPKDWPSEGANATPPGALSARA